jgi:hypothetical protein
MTKLTITLLVGTMLLAGAHLAAADEGSADCEKNVTWTDAQGVKHNDPQPWPGYQDTDPARTLFYQADAAAGNPVLFNACEGEQWDGQDASSASYHPDSDPCNPAFNTDTSHPAAVDCMGSDPNQGTSNPLAGGGVVRFRVTGDNEAGREQLYVAFQIGAVGWAAVYLGECDGTGGGLENDTKCQNDATHARDLRQGVYLRDDTPGNALATVVSSAGLTKGYVSEGDCSQSTYQKGANEGDRRQCGRDNTAIGLEELA